METIDYAKTGLVFNIQRFSIHDGPGIRTIVFLMGCPLSCHWCSNPESQKMKSVIMYNLKECLHCGKCIEVCKKGAISPHNKHFVDRVKCTGCGECANVCPAGALVLKGKMMTVEQVVKELKKDATTFRRSHGGITLSGGEPLVQNDFATELLKACKAQGWHTAIETTGYSSQEVIEQVIPYVDTVLLDLKHMDAKCHKAFTGVSNEIILTNAKRMSEISQTWVRVPVIPGFNHSPKMIEAIGAFVKENLKTDTIHLLPYHNYGSNKYDLLGRDYALEEQAPLKPEDMESYREIVQKQGLHCIISG